MDRDDNERISIENNNHSIVSFLETLGIEKDVELEARTKSLIKLAFELVRNGKMENILRKIANEVESGGTIEIPKDTNKSKVNIIEEYNSFNIDSIKALYKKHILKRNEINTPELNIYIKAGNSNSYSICRTPMGRIYDNYIHRLIRSIDVREGITDISDTEIDDILANSNAMGMLKESLDKDVAVLKEVDDTKVNSIYDIISFISSGDRDHIKIIENINDIKIGNRIPIELNVKSGKYYLHTTGCEVIYIVDKSNSGVIYLGKIDIY